ncbi:TnsD family Tn7-like transposition protein [Paenibacillus macerans]|uniref:TnsD family Tn7-like transposition protein n=1 Tax=Paenibacillus macerans TaxID=44252 RepID=UPI003D3227D8
MNDKLYSDELVCSFIARKVNCLGKKGYKRLLRNMFGSPHVQNKFDLPSRLEDLSYATGLKADELLHEHTLYPYYYSFLTNSQRDNLKLSMIKGAGTGRSPNQHAGLTRSLIRSKTQLFLCPLCLKEDINSVGEPYWHRAHQLPGVLVCYKHNVMLHSSCPICKGNFCFTTTNEICITPTFCASGHDLSLTFQNHDENLFIVAVESYGLLRGIISDNTTIIQQKYLQVLRDKGHINKLRISVIDHHLLMEQFFKRFSPEFLKDISVDIPQFDNKQSWFRKIIRYQYTKNIHPLYHLLVMVFLSDSIESFLNINIKKDFNAGGWPCLNVACRFYRKIAIDRVTLNYRKGNVRPLGVFECRYCGFTYSRVGPDKKRDDIYKIHHILKTGDLWDKKWEELIKVAKGVKYLQRELKVSGTFILKKLRESNVTHLLGGREDFVIARKTIRERFTIFLKENKSTSRTELAKKNGRDYLWLRNYDREWLEKKIARKDLILKKRKLFLITIKQHPEATRTELLEIDDVLYRWLWRNDNDWLQKWLPTSRRSGHRRTYSD